MLCEFLCLKNVKKFNYQTKIVSHKGDILQWKIPANLSLFLKSEKILALLYVGGLEFDDFRLVPSAYWPWAQISNHGRACTQALLLYLTSRCNIPPLGLVKTGRDLTPIEVSVRSFLLLKE
jgi:hypothetical protein